MNPLIANTAIAVTLMATAAAPALAERSHHQPRHASNTDWARVVGVDPIYETITHRVPVRSCWTETRYESRGHDRNSYTPGLLGAVIGGALGNELGHNKSNKRVGAVVGAALGASIANDISNRSRPHSNRVYPVSEEVCEVNERVEYEDQLIAYNVTYQYQGQTYHTQMDQHPGKRIRVAVAVTPVY